jgi:dinuclear metal center YbgI/SA1388 family protein
MLIKQVAQIIEKYAPLESGIPGDELGLLAGDAQKEVKGIVTCWSPTIDVLEWAVKRGANMVISHEPLTYGICGKDPEAHLKWYEESHVNAKVPNQRRLSLVLSKGIAVYRYHSNWDAAPKYGIADALAAVLELGNKRIGEPMTPVFITKQTTVTKLATLACRKLKLGPIRIIGDLNKVVKRVALCYGGFGQMFTFPEVALKLNADVAVFGEMLDYTIRYCVETGLAAIELGHFQSEQPGMTAMAEFLREKLPNEIFVETLLSGEPWIYFNK